MTNTQRRTWTVTLFVAAYLLAAIALRVPDETLSTVIAATALASFILCLLVYERMLGG